MAAAPSLRIVTFNAGLAVGVLPYATERLPHVIDAIAALDADVVFLQEIWLETHWEALRDAASARFPHAFRPRAATQPRRAGACTREELAELVACAQSHCAGLASDALGQCVVRRCGHLAGTLSTACLNCIVSHPVGTLDEILAPCLGSEEARPAEPRVSRAPVEMVAYGGSFGTAFLATMPLRDCDTLVYDASSLNARGAIHARLESDALGDVHVFGTHLSPGIHEEQTRQIDQLFAWIDEKAAGAPTVIAGDLNTGPTVGEDGRAPSHLPALYRRFADAGFTNTYLKGGAAKATFGHGSLTSGHHPRSGWVIDHVLVRGVPGTARAERVLDGALVVRAAGRDVRTTYSDHSGVRLTIDAPDGTGRARSPRPNPR